MIQPGEKQERILTEVRRLVRERIAPRAEEVDAAEDFPRGSFEAFRDYGLLKLALPEAYGGSGADTTTLSLVIEEVARGCPSSALLIFPTQAVIRTIMTVGTKEQKERFGGFFGPGDKLAGFCLSEPNYGSDAGSIQTSAALDGGHYVLNGAKAWVTLGGVADCYLVFLRTDHGRHTKGISALLVPKDAPGVSFGRKELKMGLRGSVTAEVAFHHARAPRENLLLGEGQGWYILTEVCNTMRVWGAASMALGLAQGALDQAVAYAKERVQFGRLLARHQAVQFMLADMKIKVEAARALIRRTTALIDSGTGSARETETLVSASKCFASDVAMEVTENAVQLCGAVGVRRGTPVERMMRDAKAIQIFDGSNQIQRMIVAGRMLV
ncbi:MAG: acyl-CoA dehydrogenase family protein [Thermodesulfobacteriota bacterium]